ncbi:class I SAM-dependent methyltransferase [soil metagenome]
MTDKFTQLSPELHRYAVANSSFRDAPAVVEVERAGEEMGDLALMQIAGDQAAMITILVEAIGARRALEVGTFLGYGAIAIAQGLPPDGELVVCELEREYADRARTHLERAGLEGLADFRLGPAIDSLKAIGQDGGFDFAFVDADKTGYPGYYEECLRLLRPGGLLLLDNVFMAGRILAPPDEQSEVVANLNAQIAADDRVEVAMLSVADGVSLIRKR